MTPQNWPQHILDTVREMGMHSPYDEEYIQAIIAKWGDVHPNTLQKIMREGDDYERAFAVFAYGFQPDVPVEEILVPLLQSTDPLKRWASAICLGKRKDERALDNLCTMLTEFLPPNEQYRANGIREWLYDNLHHETASLIGALGVRRVSPSLRSALLTMLNIEEVPALYTRLTAGGIRNIVFHEEQVVYALGRLHAYGALVGIEASKEQMALWRVHFSLGCVHGKYPITLMYFWDDNEDLLQAVKEILQCTFGLTSAEQRYGLEVYRTKKLARYSDFYGFLPL